MKRQGRDIGRRTIARIVVPHFIMQQLLSSDTIMKTKARFVPRRVDVAVTKLVAYMTTIDKEETCMEP